MLHITRLVLLSLLLFCLFFEDRVFLMLSRNFSSILFAGNSVVCLFFLFVVGL
jgi:hypothetical protein